MSPCGWDDASWEDCNPTATLMMLRAAGHPEIPATHEEVEEFRCASGRAPTGGTNLGDMTRAAKVRYGLDLPPVTAKPDLWAAMVPGTVASVSGSMGVFPAGSRWRRWDPPFKGNHQVCAFRLDSSDRVWWCDPLAPTQYRSGTQTLEYTGEWMPKADFLAFATIGAIVAPFSSPEEDMIPTAQVSERWHPTKNETTGQSNGVLRASMDRSAPIVVRRALTDHIITVAEYTSRGSSFADWRLVETTDRSVLFALRSDWVSDGFADRGVDVAAEQLAGRRQEWDRQNANARVALAPKP